MLSKIVKTSKKSKTSKTSKKIDKIKYSKTQKIKLLYKNYNDYNKFYKSLNTEEKNILKLYKLDGYRVINEFLISDCIIKEHIIYNLEEFKFNVINTLFHNANINEKLLLKTNFTLTMENIKYYVNMYINNNVIRPINVIDNIFNSKYIAKLKNDIVLYRGIRYNKGITKNLKIGDELIFKNFLSTSLFKNVSEIFAGVNGCIFIFSNMENIAYVFLHGIDTKNAYAQDLLFRAEGEYLLPRNLKFKIIAKEYLKANIPYMIKPIKINKLKQIIDKDDFGISEKQLIYYVEYVGSEPIKQIIIPSTYKIVINY